MADPVAIARDLIRCRSVTPAEGGALAYIEGRLKGAGFAVHRITFLSISALLFILIAVFIVGTYALVKVL